MKDVITFRTTNQETYDKYRKFAIETYLQMGYTFERTVPGRLIRLKKTKKDLWF